MEQGQFPLLTPPSEDQPGPISRLDHDFQDLNDRFRLPLKERNYNKQFASLYTKRLEAVTPKLVELALEKWGKDVPVKKLYQIQGAGRCILIGTLHRRMQLRPSILTEVSEDFSLQPPPPPRKRFAADEADILSIEDQVQRIPLAGDIDVKDFVTGVTIAVLGKEASDESGRFVVEDHLTLGQCPKTDSQKPFLASTPTAAAVDDEEGPAPLLLLVSGLNFGSRNAAGIIPAQLLADMLSGDLGDSALQSRTARIVRVIVAGNSISKDTQDKDSVMGPKFRQKKTSQESLDALSTFDSWLSPVAASVPIDLLPGDSDPATFLWPQQPMHACLFPKSSRSTGFKSRSNPFMASVARRLIVATSGQNIANVIRCSTIEGELDALRRTLLWRHVAPTAPDTLGCYPFLDKDPFVMETRPDLYLAGNCSRFDSCWVPSPSGVEGEGTLCVTVPRFDLTQTAVIVNLRTMTAETLVLRDVCLEEDLDM